MNNPMLGFSGVEPMALTYPTLPSPAPVMMPSAYGSLAGYSMAPGVMNTSPAMPSVTPKIDAASPGKTPFFGADGFGLNDLGDLTKIIGGFGSLWQGIQANKLMKESLALNRDAYQTNLANTISSYNLALEDRMRARGAQTGQSQSETEAAIAKYKLGK